MNVFMPRGGGSAVHADGSAACDHARAGKSGAEMFANRLRKNRRHLGKWARREGVTCYRVYDADLPEYALAVDLYEGWAHVQEYAAPRRGSARAQARLADAMAVVRDVLGIPADRVVAQGPTPPEGPRPVRAAGSHRSVSRGP